MYKLVTIEQTVRIPPNLFGLKMKDAALSMLREQLERTVDKELGIVVSVDNARIKSSGKVLQGDGAAYVDVDFDALVYEPQINEVVDGEVTEIVEFGAFVRIGPVDGLIHVSQIANDFFSFDKKTGNLVGRETKKNVKKGDKLRAKIATVSLKDTIAASKIALTSRPEGLSEKKKERAGKERKERKRG
ncbi:MAG: DNA-directed RNA polymerase [Candidatus Norongarragalinales archaeon]